MTEIVTSGYPDDGSQVRGCQTVLKVKSCQIKLQLDWAGLHVPGLVSEGRVARSPGGGGGCRTGGPRPGPTRDSTPSWPGNTISESAGNYFPSLGLAWSVAWSGLSLRISPVYVGRDSSHSSRPLTPSFGSIISPKFLFSSE